MNRILLLFLLILSMLFGTVTAEAKMKVEGQKTYIHRLYLRDKQGCGFSTDRPSHFLSQKAIERRRRQKLKIDSTDLPLSREYIEKIQLVKGLNIIGQSRWNNTVLIESNDTLLISMLVRQSFVKEGRMVWMSPDSIDDPLPKMHFKPRRFCSDACRVQYWHQHPEEMNKHSEVECRCQQCGDLFIFSLRIGDKSPRPNTVGLSKMNCCIADSLISG